MKPTLKASFWKNYLESLLEKKNNTESNMRVLKYEPCGCELGNETTSESSVLK